MLLELIGVKSLDDLIFKYAKYGTDTQFKYLVDNIILDGNNKISHDESFLAPTKRYNLLVKVETIENINDVENCFNLPSILYKDFEKCDNYGLIEYYINVTTNSDDGVDGI